MSKLGEQIQDQAKLELKYSTLVGHRIRGIGGVGNHIWGQLATEILVEVRAQIQGWVR